MNLAIDTRCLTPNVAHITGHDTNCLHLLGLRSWLALSAPMDWIFRGHRVKGREIATSPTRKIEISSRKSFIATRYKSKTPNLSINSSRKVS